MTAEQKNSIENMTDEQLVRFARILKLTKAVHEFGEEDQFVAEQLGIRLDRRLKVVA